MHATAVHQHDRNAPLSRVYFCSVALDYETRRKHKLGLFPPASHGKKWLMALFVIPFQYASIEQGARECFLTAFHLIPWSLVIFPDCTRIHAIAHAHRAADRASTTRGKCTKVIDFGQQRGNNTGLLLFLFCHTIEPFRPVRMPDWLNSRGRKWDSTVSQRIPFGLLQPSSAFEQFDDRSNRIDTRPRRLT